MRRAVWGILLVMTANSHANEQFSSYEGKAFELSSGKMLYSEYHVMRFSEQALRERVVMYRCPNGKSFGRKHLKVLNNPLVPRFETVDARTGYREGLRESGQGLQVFYQTNSKKKERSELVEQTANLVADAGFDEFVVRNWDALLKGQSIALDFVVPGQLDYIGFKLKWTGSQTFEGEKIQTFKLAPAGILGWIASGLDVGYADKDRSLRTFAGISNMRDLNGENYETKISFSRKDAKILSDDRELKSLLGEKLDTSCK